MSKVFTDEMLQDKNMYLLLKKPALLLTKYCFVNTTNSNILPWPGYWFKTRYFHPLLNRLCFFWDEKFPVLGQLGQTELFLLPKRQTCLNVSFTHFYSEVNIQYFSIWKIHSKTFQMFWVSFDFYQNFTRLKSSVPIILGLQLFQVETRYNYTKLGVVRVFFFSVKQLVWETLWPNKTSVNKYKGGHNFLNIPENKGKQQWEEAAFQSSGSGFLQPSIPGVRNRKEAWTIRLLRRETAEGGGEKRAW